MKSKKSEADITVKEYIEKKRFLIFRKALPFFSRVLHDMTTVNKDATI